jgi:Pyruvate/2-oxoacid:ferredoxin oxidoreductase delta subunit
MKQNIRPIIRIDESKCDGCGICATACAEGAIAVVDGKARLVSETYCDGLGACLGECPMGAITIEHRAAGEYDEQATHEHLAKLGRPATKQHGPQAPAMPPAARPATAPSPAACGCPGSRMRVMKPRGADDDKASAGRVQSRLAQWPVQLALVPPAAPYFRDADLLVAADCAPFAYAEFHRDFLDGKSLVVGCPKLDDLAFYREKLTQIFRQSDVRSVTVLRMEVPCCGGIVQATLEAAKASGKALPVRAVTLGIGGEVLDTEELDVQPTRAAQAATQGSRA